MKADRLRRALRAAMGLDRLDLLALYPSTVLRDHGDMHVDIEADDPRLGRLTRVPLWLGLPGVVGITVRRGARVLVGFHQGHRDKQYCDLWRGEGLLSITLEAQTVNLNADTINLAGGGPAVARVGDNVTVAGMVGVISGPGSTKVFSG